MLWRVAKTFKQPRWTRLPGHPPRFFFLPGTSKDFRVGKLQATAVVRGVRASQTGPDHAARQYSNPAGVKRRGSGQRKIRFCVSVCFTRSAKTTHKILSCSERKDSSLVWRQVGHLFTKPSSSHLRRIQDRAPCGVVQRLSREFLSTWLHLWNLLWESTNVLLWCVRSERLRITKSEAGRVRNRISHGSRRICHGQGHFPRVGPYAVHDMVPQDTGFPFVVWNHPVFSSSCARVCANRDQQGESDGDEPLDLTGWVPGGHPKTLSLGKRKGYDSQMGWWRRYADLTVVVFPLRLREVPVDLFSACGKIALECVKWLPTLIARFRSPLSDRWCIARDCEASCRWFWSVRL